MSLFKINKLILEAINSQNKDRFCEILDELVQIKTIFRKKWYLWNIVRPRDVYKMITYWVEKNITTEDVNLHNTVLWVIHEVLETTKTDKIKQTFMWGLLKRVPIITIDTLPYINKEKMTSLLTKARNHDSIYVDMNTYYIVESYVSLSDELESIREEMNIINTL